MDYNPNDPAWAMIDRLKAALQAAEDDGTLNDETFVRLLSGQPNTRVYFETGEEQDEKPLPPAELVL